MHPSPQFILIRLYQVHQTHFLNLGDLSTFNWNSIIHLSYNVSELVPTKPHHFSALQCCLKKEKQKTREKTKIKKNIGDLTETLKPFYKV